MIFRNSILSIIRSKGKTVLFTLLIFSLTLTLALGVSVWSSIEQFLDDCADYFTTIALVEYMGTGYPDDTANDPFMVEALDSFDTAMITDDDSILLWDESIRSLGYIDGFWRSDVYMPKRMRSVLVIGNIRYDERNHLYSAVVSEVLYSLRIRPNTIIYINEEFAKLEQGHYYMVFGEVSHGRSPLFRLHAAEYENPSATADGIVVPSAMDITGDRTKGDFYTIPPDNVYEQIAESLQVVNNSILVNQTSALKTLQPFHQEELYIIEGRSFTDDEYAHGSHTVVISALMAARLEIGVGDTIDLSIAISEHAGVYNSYWSGTGFSYSAPFEVVGITNTVKDKSWYVYIPKSNEIPSSAFPVGYTVGQALVHNEDTVSFYTRMLSELDERFLLTIYDQGYSAVAVPFQTILSVAKIVTAVCALVELAVLILFGFLFVFRQRETSETMQMLGTGKLRVLGYFLFSSGLISLVAAIAGAYTAYRLHDKIITLVARSAENAALIDSRYSNGNLSSLKTLEFAPHLDLDFFLTLAVIVILFALLTCVGFTISTFLNSNPGKRKLPGPRKEHKTSHLSGGSIKYAALSVLRGGSRTLVVPMLAIAAVIFFGQLARTSQRYQDQLDQVYDNTTIAGYYTDINGKQIGNQVLNAYDVFNLYRSGQVTALSVSIGKPYFYLGIRATATGTLQYIEPLFVPKNYFALESLEARILRGPDLTATNDIHTAPEFFYSNTVLMNFLDGYNESFLTVPYGDPELFSCMIPTSLMEEKGISLGDTLRVAINQPITNPHYEGRIFQHFDLRVVGSYEKEGAADTIYAPLSLFFPTHLIWGEGEPALAAVEDYDADDQVSESTKYSLQRITFNSANFKLTDSRAVTPFKDYLTDYGYSQVKKISSIREFIVINDAFLNNTVASIRQQILYIDTLYPFLYVLVAVAALIESYLLVVSRKKEFATMRGLGTTRIRSFFSFFAEQGFLCLLGTAIGLMIWMLAAGFPGTMHLVLITGFVLCYLLGSAISVTIMNQTNVLTILSDRD